MRAAAVVLLGALAPGCAWWRPETAVDPLTLPLQEADAAWAARGATGVEAAQEAVSGLLARAPDDPRVLWRASRLYWLLGFLTDDAADARNGWETGREYAYACLTADPDVAAALKQAAWSVTPAALATTTPEQRPCLLWGAANALARVEQRGAAGALDAEPACAMADRAADIVGVDEPGLLDWTQAECAWWIGADPERARARWEKARASGNGLYGVPAAAHGFPASLLPQAPAYALENRRAATLLDAAAAVMPR